MNGTESLAIQPNVYYTVQKTARLLRVSRQAVLRLLRTGRAHGVRIGRQWRVPGAALLDLWEAGWDGDAAIAEDWLAATRPSLQEVWDNQEDAVYDRL